jgi:LAO/AO transport system ATPase
MLDDLFRRLRSRDRTALARLITLASHAHLAPTIRAHLTPEPTIKSRIVAITGAGGVGKSSLVGKLIETLRTQGRTIAVLACDPQSPLTGGALLGDRFRMPSRPDDDGLFVRSLATPSGSQGIAGHLDLVIRLCEEFGFEFVLIETVGAGQGDVAVRALADAVVLLLQPEAGDDLQWEKAGVLEVADIVVIHKADLPGADRVAAQVQSALDLSGAELPVLRVSSRTSAGLEELADAIGGPTPSRRPLADPSRELLRHVTDALAAWFARNRESPAIAELIARWQIGDVAVADAVAEIQRLWGKG